MRGVGTIGSFTYARWMAGLSYECLVRGPERLATGLESVLDTYIGSIVEAKYLNSVCGFGIPSYRYPSPLVLSQDPAYCLSHYYSGGYDVEVHDRMDWENLLGNHFNKVRAEFPRCIWFGGMEMLSAFGDGLSVAVMSFFRDLYEAI